MKAEPVSPRVRSSLKHSGKSDVVYPVFFTPDGRRVLGANYPGGVIQIWDAATGKQLVKIESPPGYRSTADYMCPTPDCRTVYVPYERRKMERVEKDGKRLIRGSIEGEIRIWDLTTGEEREPLTNPGRGPILATLSPDGAWLAVLERPSFEGERPPANVLSVWDLKARKAKSLDAGRGLAAFSPDGRLLVVADSNHETQLSSVALFDPASLKELARRPAPDKGGYFNIPQFSPDGRVVAAPVLSFGGDLPPMLAFYDARTLADAGTLTGERAKGDRGWFPASPFSPDGRSVAAVDWNGRIYLWDVPGRKLIRKHVIADFAGLRDAAFSPDGKLLAVSGQHIPEGTARDPDPLDMPQPRVFLFDLTAGGDPEVIVCPHGFPGQMAFSPDGKTLALGGSGVVHLIDVGPRTGK